MTIVRCPECGKIISLRLPYHDCKSAKKQENKKGE